MSKLCVPVLFAFVASCFFSPAAEPVREEAGVSVVEVPVYVLDSDGRPVTDMHAGEFAVYEDGKKQEIVLFEPVRAMPGRVQDVETPVEVEEVETQAAATRRHFVLVFDLLFNDPDGLKRAVKGAWTFISEQASASEPVAVFTLSRSGLLMKSNFTTDRAQLAQSLATLGSKVRDTASLESAGLFDKEAIAASASKSVGGGAGTSADFFRGLEDSLMDGLGGKFAGNYDHMFQTARLDRQAYRANVQDYLDALDELAAALDVMPASKQVFLLTAGFDAGQALFNDSAAVAGLNNSMWSGETSDTTLGKYDDSMARHLRAAMERLSTAGCRFYLFETAGAKAPGDVAQDGSMSSTHEIVGRRHASFDMMADQSGGKAFKNRNDLREPIEDVLRETSHYYVLGYTPSSVSSSSKFHSIRVVVARKGVKVEHRRGYQDSKPFAEYTKLERDLHLARLLHMQQDLPGIPIHAQALTFPRADTGDRDMLVQIALPGAALIQADTGTIELYAFALTEAGDTRGFVSGAVSLADAKFAERARQAGLTYTDGMRLPPGRYRLRIIARDTSTGLAGAGETNVVIPPASTDALAMATPCFISAGASTVNQRGSSFKNADGPVYPVTFGSKQLVAAVAPVISPGQTVPLLLKLYNAPIDPATGRPNVSLAWRVRGEGDEAPKPVRCELVNVGSPAERVSEMIFSLTAPEMRPGRAHLEITASQPGIVAEACRSSVELLILGVSK